MNFKGRSYRLSVGGVRVGTIGVSSTDVRGVARNMRRASDIAGTYSAAGAGVAVVGGGGVATLQNAKGVVLEVRAVKVGLEANRQPRRPDDFDAVTQATPPPFPCGRAADAISKPQSQATFHEAKPAPTSVAGLGK